MTDNKKNKKKNKKGHFGGSVGKGNPPKENQFKKGQSGNPRGRPPKSKNTDVISAFEEIFLKRKLISVNGEDMFVSSLELYYKKLEQEMLKAGNHKDRRLFLEVIRHLKIADRFMDEDNIDCEAILNDPQYYDPDGELEEDEDDI